MSVSPSDGGCWFCRQDDGPMVFDVEFDTYVHKACIEKALSEGSEEASIMSYLLKE